MGGCKLFTFPSSFTILHTGRRTYQKKNTILNVNIISFIKDVIHSQAAKYRNRNKNHINELIAALTDVPLIVRRLKRQRSEDLLM
jgi:hypothetical protein